MSREKTAFSGHVESFPRVSGDEPGSWSWRLGSVKFSPRERG